MKRVIVDFKKLSNAILDLLVMKYPDGFGDNDIISFKNQHNETIECVEVRTEDTIYLVKVSKRLVGAMEDINGDDEVHDEEMDIEPIED
ncbi:hypothetical protein FEE95_00075 [Maribacter algarum]|uniref:DNA primase n=1 Tax=Maribacter algarum (ex Zhang et al. 2020) TaxID=2578118 RepID=A0A5S3PWY6_9FLAO|nr:hypothetical protein [Maribacter algarum]TMM59529.1 hypothetical protein FEE95_00075 [Maribacter algarum]